MNLDKSLNVFEFGVSRLYHVVSNAGPLFFTCNSSPPSKIFFYKLKKKNNYCKDRREVVNFGAKIHLVTKLEVN